VRGLNLKIVFAFFPFVMQAQFWQQKPDFPGTGRDDGTSFVIGNNAYCITGLEVGWQCTRNGAVFYGASENWGTMNDLPANKDRQYSCSFSHNGYGYLFGGVDCYGNFLKDLWRYNPGNNSWQGMLSIPDSGRSGAGCFVIGDTAYVVGGKNSISQGIAEVWAYSILSDTWSKKNNLPLIGCWRGSAFAIDTVGYLCFGAQGNGSYNHNMYSYQHASDTWTIVPGISLPARNYVGSTVVYNKACMFGGADSSGRFANELIEFDPVLQNIFVHTGIPDFPRKGGMAFSVNNMFYYTTGLDSTSTRQKQTWRNSQITGKFELRNLSADITIFPQPAGESLSIRSYSKEIIAVQLFNLLGEQVREFNNVNSLELEVSCRELIPGSYYLNIELIDGYFVSKKLIKAQ